MLMGVIDHHLFLLQEIKSCLTGIFSRLPKGSVSAGAHGITAATTSTMGLNESQLHQGFKNTPGPIFTFLDKTGQLLPVQAAVLPEGG